MRGMGTNYELGTLLELENKALINIQFNKLLSCSMYYFVLSKSKRICPEGGKYWVGHTAPSWNTKLEPSSWSCVRSFLIYMNIGLHLMCTFDTHYLNS